MPNQVAGLRNESAWRVRRRSMASNQTAQAQSVWQSRRRRRESAWRVRRRGVASNQTAQASSAWQSRRRRRESAWQVRRRGVASNQTAKAESAWQSRRRRRESAWRVRRRGVASNQTAKAESAWQSRWRRRESAWQVRRRGVASNQTAKAESAWQFWQHSMAADVPWLGRPAHADTAAQRSFSLCFYHAASELCSSSGIDQLRLVDFGPQIALRRQCCVLCLLRAHPVRGVVRWNRSLRSPHLPCPPPNFSLATPCSAQSSKCVLLKRATEHRRWAPEQWRGSAAYHDAHVLRAGLDARVRGAHLQCLAGSRGRHHALQPRQLVVRYAERGIDDARAHHLHTWCASGRGSGRCGARNRLAARRLLVAAIVLTAATAAADHAGDGAAGGDGGGGAAAAAASAADVGRSFHEIGRGS
eukprot:363525-Chlamydomonas_euryale.AAC.7